MPSLTEIPPSSVIRYDGFTFGEAPSTPPTYSLSGEPVRDDANRSLLFVRYRLEVSAIVYGESEAALGEEMKSIRARLAAPGKTLELTGLGIGDILPSAGEVRPLEVSLHPVGGVLAFELFWRCEFGVYPSSSLRSGDWLAVTASQRHELDDLGFATRTIEGHIDLVQLDGARVPADSARDRLHFAVPAGFRRVKSSFASSGDQRRLDFLVVDEQFRRDPFPPGIAAFDVDYSLEQTPAGLIALLAGSAEAIPGERKSRGAEVLLAVAVQKSQSLSRSVRPAIAAPARVMIRHKLGSRKTELEIEWQAARCIADWLNSTGIWDPLPESSDQTWRTSLSPLWTTRGSAGLQVDPRDVALVNVSSEQTKFTLGRGPAKVIQAAPPLPLPRLFPVITPEISWLAYEIKLEATREESVSLHLVSQSVEAGSAGASGLGSPFSTPVAGWVRETHGAPRQQVVLSGRASRIAFLPEVPALQSVGGCPVQVRRQNNSLQQTGTLCGRPLYELRWSITYDVIGYVNQLEAPAGKL